MLNLSRRQNDLRRADRSQSKKLREEYRSANARRKSSIEWERATTWLDSGPARRVQRRESEVRIALSLDHPDMASDAVETAALALTLLQRVRSIQVETLESAYASLGDSLGLPPEGLSADEVAAIAVIRSSRELVRLQDYQRKARSRGRRAFL
jgi:hypothetical protein